MGEFIDKTKAAANKAVGSAKDSIGEATGDARLRSEGKTQKTRGTAQDISGTIKGALGNDL